MTSRSEGVNLLQGFGLKLAWESGLKVIQNVLLIRLISLFVTGIQFDQLLYLIEGDWDYSASPRGLDWKERKLNPILTT